MQQLKTMNDTNSDELQQKMTIQTTEPEPKGTSEPELELERKSQRAGD